VSSTRLALALGLVLGSPGSLAAQGDADAGSVLGRYDFDTPAARSRLPRSLDEISGLAVASDGRVFAHADERAEVFELDQTTGRIVKRFSFGAPAVRGDFEAITLAGDRIVLTTSDGILYAGIEGSDGEAVPFTVTPTGIGRSCEVEGMAYDPAGPSLLLACKVPRVRALRGYLTVFRWSLDRRELAAGPALRVPLSRITAPLGVAEFHPSELVRDPESGHYLLLAARARALAEIAPDGQLVRGVRLRADLHRQAEGLAVRRDGSLLVADEGAGGRATLTTYRRAR
jgi:uncharacterized protein YjiK